MTNEDILKQVQDALIKGLYIKQDQKFTPEMQWDSNLGLDSLDKVEIKLTMEDYFNIVLPDDSFADDVITVEDAVNLISKHIK